jgi:hypothetical protein
MAFEGTLVFFPSVLPLRAIVKERAAPVAWDTDTGYSNVADAVAAAANADARLPWIESHPMLLREAIPMAGTTPWRVRDPAGYSLPLSHRFRQRFRLLAVSGGAPAPMFGEWDGESLTPLTVWGESGAVSL